MILADVWKTAPFMALLLLAGLQGIPDDLYDAAKVDGATAWQRFRRITLPLLRPAIAVALIFRTLDALRIFDLPYVLTRGRTGPRPLSLLRLAGAGQQRPDRLRLGALGAHVRDRDGRLLPVHPLRGGQHPRRARRTAIARQRKGSGAGPALAGGRRDHDLLPVPVLLAHQHLAQDGPGPLGREPRPAQPLAGQLRLDLQRCRLHDGAAQQRVVAGLTTFFALLFGSFAAYALARLRFRFKFVILAIVLSITTFPPIAIAAPLFKLWTDTGLYNT